jgi:photosystem II stability/assembly factor-like uncharacterized protein
MRRIQMNLMRYGLLLSGLLFACVVCGGEAQAQWTTQQSGTTVRLRGVSAVSRRVAWASGDKGTVARTVDGGKTWSASVVPGASELDFRDVDAFDADNAYLLAIGPGEKSRIYRTTDGGRKWSLQFINSVPAAFFDSMAFWDKNHGIAVSDPVDGRFLIISTEDGGATWKQMPAAGMPPALKGEGAFAASGTCITVSGKRDVWFATGGGTQARVFHSQDRGRTWTASNTPILSGRPPTGIFSIAFRDTRHGVIVGGDYEKEQDATRNAAVTTDGGQTWALIDKSKPAGYRSCVLFVPGTKAPTLVAVGPSGADYSLDNGRAWTPFGQQGFHSASFAAATDAGWAVGEKGLIAKYTGAVPDTGRRATSK